MERGHCRDCKAPVIWVRNGSTGRLQILDSEPVPDGNIVIRDTDCIHCMVLKKGELYDQMAYDPSEPRYRDHHSTCPHAAKWRRKK